MEAFTVDDLLQARAGSNPSLWALQGVDGFRLSYAELESLTGRHAEQLTRWGFDRTSRIAIVLPNGPALAVTLLSTMRMGIAAPLNPGLRTAEFRYYLEDLQPGAVILLPQGAPECREAALDLGIPIIESGMDGYGAGSFEMSLRAPVGPPGSASPSGDSVALVLHTSGTTSRPKIVPLTHLNLLTSGHNVAASLALRADDVCLQVMPLFHIHGIVAGLLASLVAGGTVVATPGFLASKFLDWMVEEDATWYTAVPTMHQAVLRLAGRDERVSPQRLRLIRSSSASLAPSVLEQLRDEFGVPVIEAYGMTEAAHQMTSNPLPPGIQKAGSVGTAAGPEVSVAGEKGEHLAPGEVGEVVIRGDNVTGGYWDVEEPSNHFLAGGWFRTGDQGYFDSDGYLFLTGRLKEIINRGGETIAPREIDEALLQHPAVAQAVAFAVPDERLGEEVAAAVVLDEHASIREAELVRWLEDRISFAKLPKRIVFVEEMPKGPTGKLQRIGLAARLGIDSLETTDGEPGARHAPVEPSAETIRRVVAQWESVLEVPAVGLDEAFLDVGGDSLAATRLLVGVRDEFGIDVPLMAFFSASTVRAQARLIEALLEP